MSRMRRVLLWTLLCHSALLTAGKRVGLRDKSRDRSLLAQQSGLPEGYEPWLVQQPLSTSSENAAAALRQPWLPRSPRQRPDHVASSLGARDGDKPVRDSHDKHVVTGAGGRPVLRVEGDLGAEMARQQEAAEAALRDVPQHSTVAAVAGRGVFVRRSKATGGTGAQRDHRRTASSGGQHRAGAWRWGPRKGTAGSEAAADLAPAEGDAGGDGGDGGGRGWWQQAAAAVAQLVGWGGTTHRDSVEDGDSVQQDVGQQRGGLQRAGRQRQGAQHGEREQGTPGGRRGLAQADTGGSEGGQEPEGSATLNPRLACHGCPPTDTRLPVNNSRVVPFAAVGLLARRDRSLLSAEVAQCTGTVIGPRHVVTAAHCVVAPDRWSFIEEVTFFPQMDADDPSAPSTGKAVETVRVLERYIRLGSASIAALNYDFALLTLAADDAMPPDTPTLPLAPGEGRAVLDLQTAGYPGDKPAGTLWTTTCPGVAFDFDGSVLRGCRGRCDNMVVHNCVSWEGQSGSAIWQTAVVDPGTSGPDGGGPPAPAAGSGPGSPAPPPAGSTPQQATVQAAPTPAAEVMSANGSSNGNATAPTVPAAQLGDVSTAQPNTIRAVLTGVITTSDGTSYNVGTQLNAFVYGTLASWYNEDVQAAGQPQRQMALLPGPPPDAPAAEMEPGSPGGGGGSSWISQHVWVPIVGAVGGLVLLGSGLAFCVLPLLGISVLGRLCS